MAQQAQQLAATAMQNEQAHRQNLPAGADAQVRWVDENSFASLNNPTGIAQLGRPPATPPPMQAVLQPAARQYIPSESTAGQGQTVPPAGRQLPTMQPSAGWISNTPYEMRR